MRMSIRVTWVPSGEAKAVAVKPTKCHDDDQVAEEHRLTRPDGFAELADRRISGKQWFSTHRSEAVGGDEGASAAALPASRATPAAQHIALRTITSALSLSIELEGIEEERQAHESEDDPEVRGHVQTVAEPEPVEERHPDRDRPDQERCHPAGTVCCAHANAPHRDEEEASEDERRDDLRRPTRSPRVAAR